MELYQALITLDGWTFLAQICNLMIQLVIFKKFLQIGRASCRERV